MATEEKTKDVQMETQDPKEKEPEKTEEKAPEGLAIPEKIYCLGCRDHTKVVECEVKVMHFESSKNHVPGKRLAFRGKCAVCGRQVSRFAADPNKKEEEKPQEEKSEKPQKKHKSN
jgi:hypothetical protein